MTMAPPDTRRLAPRMQSSTRPQGRPPVPRRLVPRVGEPRRRHSFLSILSMAVLTLFAARLVQIQVVDADALAAEALEVRLVTHEISVPRSDIVDRNGVILATSVDRIHVWVNQKQLATWKPSVASGVTTGGAAGAAAVLAPLLDMNEADLRAMLTGDRSFVYVQKNASGEVWEAVRAQGIPGVYGEPSSERLYPNGSVAGNVIGFVGGVEDRSGNWGLAGVESAYENLLVGTSGSVTYEAGRGNLVIPTGVKELTAAVPGSSVTLTLDRDLQWLAQESIDDAVRTSGAEWGSVIAMDVTTGEIYILADSSTVDPNHPGVSDAEDRGSRAVSAIFEPGSTAKIVTMAALIEEGLASPTTPYTAPYKYTTSNGQTFRDSHEHDDQRLTLTGILARSSNTGTIIAGQGLTNQQRYDYLHAFGFGEATHVGLPGESSGILHDVANWDGRTQYGVLFGQGLSATALQNAQVYQAIANGGVLVPPTVVAGFRDADGVFTARETAEPRRVVSEETARQLMLMLESAVDEGTGMAARVDGYRIAGKTGTAQAADANGGMTSTVASFVGVAPADHPRIVVSVMLYNPTTSIWGGEVAAPVFADVTEQVLRALGVPPSGEAASLYPATWG